MSCKCRLALAKRAGGLRHPIITCVRHRRSPAFGKGPMVEMRAQSFGILDRSLSDSGILHH